MTIRIVSRVTMLLVALAAATALMLGALSLLASTATAEATPLPEHDQVAAVERAVEVPADAEQAATSPTPAVVLVFPGIVLRAHLPSAHRVPVYHRSYHHSDWI